MDQQLVEHILDELKAMRNDIRELNNSHMKLENKVYLISICLGIISGQAADLIKKILGM